MATFQERINQLYEEAKDTDYRLTQTEYAAKFGATRNQLKGWLDGRGEPSSEMMKLIAKMQGVSVSWLVGETNIRNFTNDPSANPIDLKIDHLPPEAIQNIKEYIELMRLKYRQKR
ncbi:helix-turn-helix transcriptional regulator|uniref:Helix-turn-helix n=1 Tax=Dendrosporobacter quercicolus TaxID=146817 RepID=A0A1G9XED8_9FIRM|nr:helix-turn-helix transcriptional regulator [Dendrosporobacter quercicolus]NSL49688.1 helix-turn-helix transcriptional regulator [Dendrosporobacter quercicolus DSM 1736]SDM95179.1 Helix-turn-helix [Dendrosporobacter quercicolus]